MNKTTSVVIFTILAVFVLSILLFALDVHKVLKGGTQTVTAIVIKYDSTKHPDSAVIIRK